MSEYAIMPLADYSAACGAIRSKTGSAANIKSGQMAGLINSIETGGGGGDTPTTRTPGLKIWDNGTPFLIGDSVLYKGSATTNQVRATSQSFYDEYMTAIDEDHIAVVNFYVIRPPADGTYADYTGSSSGTKLNSASSGWVNNSKNSSYGRLRIGYVVWPWRSAGASAASYYAYATGCVVTPVWVGVVGDFGYSYYASTGTYTKDTSKSSSVGTSGTSPYFVTTLHGAIWYGVDSDLTRNFTGTSTSTVTTTATIPAWTGMDYSNTTEVTVPQVSMLLSCTPERNGNVQMNATYTGNSEYMDHTSFQTAMYFATYFV